MKKTIPFLMALALASVLAGCNNQGEESATGAPRKKLHLAFVANNVNDYWDVVRLGCDSAASQLGNVELDFRTPPARTAAAQQDIVNQLVASGVDGIAISPIDADSETDFLNSIPTNVLLVCADSDAGKSKRVCYIGTDNVAAGKQVAELLKAALPGGGKIILFLANTNTENLKERAEGIASGLAGSNIQIVDMLADQSESTVAEKNAEGALAGHPDLAGMVGLNSYTGPAILLAARSAGKAGQVKIICFDQDSDTLAAIAAGDIYGTIVQKPFLIGSDSILEMGNYLRGEQKGLAAGKILIPARTITKDNIDDFLLEQKIILQKSTNSPLLEVTYSGACELLAQEVVARLNGKYKIEA
jgi:ribose transport system substrate-binding protein